MEYQFGDSDLAARRLAVLAETFQETTAAFLRDAAPPYADLAVDLGCGPGHTTHLLQDTTGCRQAVGLDNSESFLALARATETSRVTFRRHDVTETPFPVPAADVVFSRYLLAHLPDAEGLVARWATQLAPGGLLLLEEVEWIRTTHEAFVTYLGTVEAMLADQGSVLCIGPALDALDGCSGLRKSHSSVRRLRIGNGRAARMFHMNIQTWRHRPYVEANVAPERVAALEEQLRSIADSGETHSDIEWGLRQIAFQRVEA
jgi:SAM-dependent methyltransferase